MLRGHGWEGEDGERAREEWCQGVDTLVFLDGSICGFGQGMRERRIDQSRTMTSLHRKEFLFLTLRFRLIILGDPQCRLEHGGFDDLKLDILPNQILFRPALS